MKYCDNAFPIELFKRDNYKEIIDKILNHAFFYAAYGDEEKSAIGYVAFYANDIKTKTAFITNIGVLEIHQRIHVGSYLMKTCIDVSRKNGMKFLRLEVLKENNKAINFYRHWEFEFEQEGEGDTYFMRRCLL